MIICCSVCFQVVTGDNLLFCVFSGDNLLFCVFSGRDCGEPDCPGDPECSGQGYCDPLTDPPRCTSCHSGWFGPACDEPCVFGHHDVTNTMCECNTTCMHGDGCNVQCSDHGVCDAGGECYCEPLSGWWGPYCEAPGCPRHETTLLECSGHGDCNSEKHECECFGGWQVWRVIYQISPVARIVMPVVYVTQLLTHRAVQTVRGRGWDQPAMTPVYMAYRLHLTPLCVCVRRAGPVLGVTPSVLDMVILYLADVCATMSLAGKADSVTFLAVPDSTTSTAAAEVNTWTSMILL